MTFMYPNYYSVPMVNRSRLAFKYRMFQYSHGQLDSQEKLLKTNRVVVFVPGSVGSYGQVRSIGKETIERLSNKGLLKSQVAFYTLDFDEEPSAFNGIFIEQQAEFLEDSLRYIGELHNYSDLEIVIFAHSMGGVVARRALAKMDSTEQDLGSSVKALVTLSTPHSGPVVGLDIPMFLVYRGLHSHEDPKRSYVSIGGGYRDTLVRSELVRMDRSRYKRSVSTLSHSTVGISTDHLAILWCNEVISDLGQALFDVLVPKEDSEGKKKNAIVKPDQLHRRYKSKGLPILGFVKGQQQALGVGHALGHFFTDIIARKYAVSIFQYMFGVSLFAIARAGGTSKLKMLGWFVVFYACYLGSLQDVYRNKLDTFGAVPLVMIGAAMGLNLVLLVVSQILFKGLKLILPYFTMVSGVFIFGYYNLVYKPAFEIVFEESIALCFLWEMVNIVFLILCNLSVSPFDKSAKSRCSLPTNLDAQHLSLMFGLLYFSSLVGWIGPVVHSLNVLKTRLQFDEVYPPSGAEKRGSVHGVEQSLVPENPGVLFPYEKSLVREQAYMVICGLLAFPVFIHLLTLYCYPRYRSEEKVLDSNYQKVVKTTEVPDSPASASTDFQSTHRGKRRRAKKKRRDSSIRRRPEIVEAVEEEGALMFSDTEYSGKPVLLHFENGESVQLDDVMDFDPTVDILPDAIPLIDNERNNGPGGSVSCVLVQRIRSATTIFTPGVIFLNISLALAVLVMLAGAESVFCIQFAAAIMAVLSLGEGKNALPLERVVHKKVG
eukprot:CAMPEP_0203793036 /NCGR_PEP_ID=MMETSP0100_2-20121128/5622_1 /ASSEMBLY_ACC=CAM_ASM_000210 /TAXON_ID=96639 /ORGANISM=" , Strain NY0313808BC1" /LENGTH=770 /DNA_ID=CAMNT_0050696731 /DNA_START=160 /DNA_END=2475 /DNA_ORIENTATION=+